MSLSFIALVLTTSGPDPRRDRVTAVSAVTADAEGRRTRFDAVVRSRSTDDDSPRSELEAGDTQPLEADWPEVAAKLRALLANGRLVTHDADRSLAVLAAEGVRLDQAPLDTAELASILVPALPATDLDTLREALGGATGDGDLQRNPADALADVFEALLARIASYDDVTLERLATHIAEGGWHFYADDENPERAASLVSTWSQVFTEQVRLRTGLLEGPNEFIEVTLTQTGQVPRDRSMSLSTYLFIGAVAFLAIGSFFVLFFNKPK